jgi:hypothetical protein
LRSPSTCAEWRDPDSNAGSLAPGDRRTTIGTNLDDAPVGLHGIGALRRRLARRAALVRQRTRSKNEVHAVLSRCLLGRPPASDLFGKAGRVWLGAQDLVEEERETVDGCLRQIDFLAAEIALVDRKLAQFVLGSADAQRLMTIPGIDITTAAALIAAIGDIARFASLASWSPIWAWTRRSASAAPSPPATAESPSHDHLSAGVASSSQTAAATARPRAETRAAHPPPPHRAKAAPSPTAPRASAARRRSNAAARAGRSSRDRYSCIAAAARARPGFAHRRPLIVSGR